MKSAAVPIRVATARLVSFGLSCSLPSAFMISRLSRSTIGCGVPAGAAMPVKETETKSGTPASIMVGRLGAWGIRRLARDREALDRSVSDRRQRGLGAVEADLSFSLHNRLRGLAAALVGDMGDVESKTLLEHFTDQVQRRADAGGGVIQFARVFTRVGNDVLYRLEAGSVAGNQDVGRGADQRDGGESLGWIVTRLPVQQGRNHQIGRVAEQQRVTVRRRCGDVARADRPARAGTVFDIDRLAKAWRNSRCDQPRHHIGRPARRERRYELDRLSRIIRRRRGGCPSWSRPRGRALR